MKLRDIILILIQTIVVIVYSLRIQPMIDNFWLKWAILFVLFIASSLVTDWIIKNFK